MDATPHHLSPRPTAPTPIPSPAPTPEPCPHGLSDPAWCDLCLQGIGR
jgi:hypothetical protein